MSDWKPIESIADLLHNMGYRGPLKSGILRWGKNEHNWAAWHYTVDCQFLIVGDWRGDQVERFYQSDKTVGKKELNTAYTQLMAEYRRKREAAYQQTRQEVLEYWESLSTEGVSPYIVGKNLEDTKYGRYDKDNIVYAVRDVKGLLHSWQRISPGGDKFICPDSAVKGHFVLLGDTIVNRSDRVILCEGIATGLTIHIITGYSVCCCLAANNIEPVAGQIAKVYDKCRFVYCADDDWKTTDAKGDPYNAGVEGAKKAVKYHGGQIVLPVFDESRGDKDTDFNDMMQSQGCMAVSDIIMPSLQDRKTTADLYQAINPTRRPIDKAPEDIEEHELASKILAETEIRTDSINNLYAYSDYRTIWNPVTYADMEAHVARNMPNDFSIAKMGNVVKRIFTHSKTGDSYIGEINESRFVCNEGLTPYEIPTLEGVYCTLTETLRPRVKEDYSTFILPYTIDPDAACPAWDHFVHSWFEFDPEKEEKTLLLQEYMGYCLLYNNVMYKKGLYIYGPKNTGKSVILKALLGVIGNDLCSQVDMAEMSQRFSAWAMYNKLVNISAETNISSMRDAAKIKKLIGNGDPVMIERKNKDPFVDILRCKHVIAGNTLPQVPDDSSGAVAERLLILLMTRQIKVEERRYDLEQQLTKKDEQQGIFNWMVKGASRLTQNNGGWTLLPSNEMMNERMSVMSNPVTMFVSEYLQPCEEMHSVSLANAHEEFAKRTANRMPLGEFMQALIDSGQRIEKRKLNGIGREVWRIIGLRIVD